MTDIDAVAKRPAPTQLEPSAPLLELSVASAEHLRRVARAKVEKLIPRRPAVVPVIRVCLPLEGGLSTTRRSSALEEATMAAGNAGIAATAVQGW